MRQLLLALLCAVLVSAWCALTPEDASAECAKKSVNRRTGELVCLPQGDDGTSSTAPTAHSIWRAPTPDELLSLYDAATRRDLESAGAFDPDRISAMGGDVCVVAQGRARSWTGSGWTDIGARCPLASAATATISPEEAAARAVARLRFTAAAPGMAPNRSINGLPFDVPVGYPVWAWADGGTLDPRTAHDEVGGRSVSLSLRLDRLSWDFGDGSATLSCGRGTRWTQSTPTGAISPTCGHTYEQPGRYTVSTTTRWTVDWTVDGVRGSQTIDLVRTRTFAVGELQVLVR